MNAIIKNYIKIGYVSAIFIILIILIIFLINRFFIPLIPSNWSQILIWSGSSLLILITILSGIAQFTGINVKDFVLGKSNESLSSEKMINEILTQQIIELTKKSLLIVCGKFIDIVKYDEKLDNGRAKSCSFSFKILKVTSSIKGILSSKKIKILLYSGFEDFNGNIHSMSVLEFYKNDEWFLFLNPCNYQQDSWEAEYWGKFPIIKSHGEKYVDLSLISIVFMNREKYYLPVSRFIKLIEKYSDL